MIKSIKDLLHFGKHPAFPNTTYWRSYEQCFQQDYPKKTPLNQVRFVVLDTETTGLDVQNDEILSLAAVAIKDSSIDLSDRFEALFRPTHKKTVNKGILIHGILGKHSEDAQETAGSLINFLDYLKNSIIVGHHIRFDQQILNKSLQQHLGAKLINRTLDTARMAQRLHNGFQSGNERMQKEFRLDQLCKTYNIKIQSRHTAAGDTIMTAILFLKLLARLKKRGVSNLKELMK